MKASTPEGGEKERRRAEGGRGKVRASNPGLKRSRAAKEAELFFVTQPVKVDLLSLWSRGSPGLPARPVLPILKLLSAWMEIHKDELAADWELAVSGQQPYRIEPLR